MDEILIFNVFTSYSTSMSPLQGLVLSWHSKQLPGGNLIVLFWGMFEILWHYHKIAG
jgi:hypothetical protein